MGTVAVSRPVSGSQVQSDTGPIALDPVAPTTNLAKGDNAARLRDLQQHIKFQLNYIHVMLDNPTFGNSNADIVAMRTQIDFQSRRLMI